MVLAELVDQRLTIDMPKRTKAKSPRRELMREELLTKATEVFEQKGYAQATIEDIANALSLKRSALYYYFKTKNDIILALIKSQVEGRAREMEELVASHTGTPTEKLRALLLISILCRTTGGTGVRALESVGWEMPPKTKAAFERARRRILDVHIRVMNEGMKRGEFRIMDPNIASLAVLGVANWTSSWYSPTGKHTPQQLADQLIEIAISGIAKSGRERPQGRSQTEIIALMRAGIGELERLARE